MLKPVNISGVEQKKTRVFFVGIDGLGYWFISSKSRLWGESKTLKSATIDVQKLELSNSWTILEIVKDNREELLKEYLEKNPDGLNDEELKALKGSNREIELNLELYIRQLIRDGEMTHPVLWKYRERLSQDLINKVTFEYQAEMIKAAFMYRVVTDITKITIDENDPEKGFINTQEMLECDFVGYQGDIEGTLKQFDERLPFEIYKFVQSEYAGRDWLTRKDVEKIEQELNQDEDNTEDTELEKKSPVSK